MKSCLGLLLTLIILLGFLGTVAAVWYLSDTAEFSRKDAPAMSR